MKIYISENLRHLRKKVVLLSQQKLAEKLKIKRAGYAKYEEGLNEPNLGILIKISRFYKISIDDLITKKIKRIK